MTIHHIIIGLGQTGLSVAYYLRRQGVSFAVCDTREKPANLAEFQQQFSDVAIFCGPLDHDLLCRAQQLIVSPGVAIATPAIQAAADVGVEIVGDIELFLRVNTAPVIAITGSNGKTTVTTLVGEMAKAAGMKVAVAGNIGVSVLDLLDEEYDLVVLELSSFQLETTYSLHARTAVVLNVSDNHMDRYDTFADYVAAKNRIYSQGASKELSQQASVSVINLDNRQSWENAALSNDAVGFTVKNPESPLAGSPLALKHIFSLQHGQVYCDNEAWIARAELSIQATHHIANLLAAFALAQAASIPKSAMLQVARSFTGITHRCQKFFEKNQIQWINDSKGTTVAASTVAIESIKETITGKVILIAGGDGKGADFSAFAKPIAQYCRAVILLGRDAKKIAAIIPSAVEQYLVATLSDAVLQAKELAQAGDAVLLSPACASTDMFKNFNERGEQFMAEVKRVNHV